MSASGPVLVEVTRGEVVESVHTGSVVALRADGSVALAVGDVTSVTFPRSSNKPLQVVGLLEQGWAPTRTEHLAIAAASHSGEPGHLAVVREVLGDVPVTALGCPPSLPLDPAVLTDGPSRLQMNCSGKHAAMLATCAVNGWPLGDYLAPEHPLQVALTSVVARLSGAEPYVVTDGCGAPQHGMGLTALATAFLQVAGTPVADAMRAHPWLVGGTGRDVTTLMQAVPHLLAKDGAEGVYAAALPDVGAVAVKVDDGASRARTPVLLAGLRALGVEGPASLASLPVLGGSATVGAVRLAPALA